MNPLEWAHKKIVFDEATALIGKFDISKYRMLEKPLLALDNIKIKRMTVLKASSAGGTVFMQIAMCYWLDQRPGSIQCAMQSGDDATDWMKQRGRKWLNRIPSLKETLSADKYATTNTLWQWPHQFLLFTGPGENAQQAKQVTHLITDESHVDEFKEGALASFEERMSKRWNRMALHVSTSANAGKEIDRFYYMGGQNEFHFRCPKCTKLFWPLWDEESKTYYNGHRVFIYKDGDIEPFVACPHCDESYSDTSRDRYALHEGADYVRMNTGNLEENESFRWNCFAAHWMSWAGHLAKYRESIEAARMGQLEPHENWVKKRLCQSYVPRIPDLGEGCGSTDYKLDSIWITEHPQLRVGSFDVQDSGGFHLWAQADEFNQVGDSRRLAYDRLSSWADARAFQQHYGIANRDTFCDAGHRMREVFAQCAVWEWYALFADDSTEFAHKVTDARTHEVTIIRKPYSQTQIEDPMSGKNGSNVIIRAGRIPKGMCGSRHWSKFAFGSYLMALKAGNGQYYGIASDINPEYSAQLNSYTFSIVLNKTTGVRTTILRQVKVDDHSFSTSSMNLVGATIGGYFPLSKITEPQPELATA